MREGSASPCLTRGQTTVVCSKPGDTTQFLNGGLSGEYTVILVHDTMCKGHTGEGFSRVPWGPRVVEMQSAS
jgi:hypothetical protein